MVMAPRWGAHRLPAAGKGARPRAAASTTANGRARPTARNLIAAAGTAAEQPPATAYAEAAVREWWARQRA